VLLSQTFCQDGSSKLRKSLIDVCIKQCVMIGCRQFEILHRTAYVVINNII